MDKGLFLCLILSCILLLFFITTITGTDVVSFFQEKPSPAKWIEENNVQVFSDRVIIHLDDARLVSYSDSNSMDPTLDDTSKGIEIKPRSQEDIHIGDIIAYTSGNEIISHRVVAIGHDDNGWFCKVKGDNDYLKEKIRFSQIVGVVVMIIY